MRDAMAGPCASARRALCVAALALRAAPLRRRIEQRWVELGRRRRAGRDQRQQQRRKRRRQRRRERGSGGGAAEARAAAAAAATRAPTRGWPPTSARPWTPASPGQVDITFNVTANRTCSRSRRTSTASTTARRLASTHATISRVGGNRMTAYNWENNASNAGSDYQFENDDYLCSTSVERCVPEQQHRGRVHQGRRRPGRRRERRRAHHGAHRRLRLGRQEPRRATCETRASNYLQTRFKQNKAAKGAAFVVPARHDRRVRLRGRDGAAGSRRPPTPPRRSASSSTTSRTSGRPRTPRCTRSPVTYAELAQRNVEYATAIKTVVAERARRRPGQLRLGGLRHPAERDRLAGRRRLHHVVARSDEGGRDDRRQAPRRRAGPALVPGGDRRRHAHHRRRHRRRRGRGARAGAALALGHDATPRRAGSPSQHQRPDQPHPAR